MFREDFVAFDEVLENVDELQERLMLHLETHGQVRGAGLDLWESCKISWSRIERPWTGTGCWLECGSAAGTAGAACRDFRPSTGCWAECGRAAGVADGCT